MYLLYSCVGCCPHFCCCACRCGIYVQGLHVWAHDPCDACHVTEKVQGCSQRHHAPSQKRLCRNPAPAILLVNLPCYYLIVCSLVAGLHPQIGSQRSIWCRGSSKPAGKFTNGMCSACSAYKQCATYRVHIKMWLLHEAYKFLNPRHVRQDLTSFLARVTST